MQRLLKNFECFKLERILWSKNNGANALTKLASMRLSNGNWSIIRSVMLALTIDRNKSMCIDGNTSWVDPLKAYLSSGTLLEHKKEDDKVKK